MIGFPRRADASTRITINSIEYRARDLRRANLPCYTLTSKSRSWQRITSAGEQIRVTLEEASVLAGFPSWWPWQGSRTKSFESLANACAPPMAKAILGQFLFV